MKLISLITIGIISIVTNVSLAASVTSAPKATATLASTCKITINDIVYGDITASSISDIGSKVYGTSDVNVLCSNKVSYNLAMSLGSNFANNSRNIKGTKGQVISYSLSCTLDNTPYCAWFGTNYVSGTGNGGTQTVTVYTNTVKGFYTPDNYSDTMSVTITY